MRGLVWKAIFSTLKLLKQRQMFPHWIMGMFLLSSKQRLISCDPVAASIITDSRGWLVLLIFALHSECTSGQGWMWDSVGSCMDEPLSANKFSPRWRQHTPAEHICCWFTMLTWSQMCFVYPEAVSPSVTPKNKFECSSFRERCVLDGEHPGGLNVELFNSLF